MSDELLQSFLAEAKEALANIENELLEIEEKKDSIDKDLVNKVFRAIHTIKGGAQFLGLEKIKHLAHQMENVLNLIRNQKLKPESNVIDILLKSSDVLRSLLNNIGNDSSIDILSCTKELENFLNEPIKEIKPEVIPEIIPEIKSEQHVIISEFKKNIAETSLRVNVNVIDTLMNLASELVLGRNQLVQAVEHKDAKHLDFSVNKVNAVTSELQEAIMRTRMQPVGNIFSKYPRVVRDLSKELNKEVILKVEGEEVELDKTIIEAISDPLLHLIRNAMDHGIETPEERIAAGKERFGTILLKAYHSSGLVQIEVSEDGQGINSGLVKKKALDQNLITQDEAKTMSQRDINKLIFLPGFSTAKIVTDISGRGVGMDVVKNNIENLGGVVEIESVEGKGTTIILKLPLTLAIIPCLKVSVEKEVFAIPQTNLIEIVQSSKKDIKSKIEKIGSAEVLRLRGNLIPLIRLGIVLGIDSNKAKKSDHFNIVLLQAGTLIYGLVVDEFSDSEEIVVKSLGKLFNNCKCYAGATILGNGNVALILDVAGIARYTNIEILKETTEEKNVSNKKIEQLLQPFLLFKNNEDEEFAIALNKVSRIEKVEASRIEKIKNEYFMQYREGILSLISLEQAVDIKPKIKKDQYEIIVLKTGSKKMGLWVDQVLDIIQVGACFDGESVGDKCLPNVLIFQNKTIFVIDIDEVILKIHPDWLDYKIQHDKQNKKTILFIEDSNFFRNQMRDLLIGEGFEVIEAENGQKGLDLFLEKRDKIDLVLSDIEMPVMNGLELVSKIRKIITKEKLPVFALTTLAEDTEIQKGLDAGFNEYLIKLNKENLLSVIKRYVYGTI